jgi:hypothetical protein
MPSEHQSAGEARGLLSWLTLGTPTQQCEQRDAREQGVDDYVRTTMDVTTCGQHVHRQSNHQQAGCADVKSLKVPVARPKPPADRSASRYGKKEQRQQRQDPGVFVAGSGQLDMLSDPVIDAEQQPHVKDRSSECRPAEKLVTAERKCTGAAGPRPDRQHAEDEARGDRAKA